MNNLKQLLTVPFNIEGYNKFSNEFFKSYNHVPVISKNIPSMFSNTIQSYSVHGSYEDPNGDNVIILSVKVKNNSSAKQAQRNFVAYLLTNDFDQFNAALVAYYDDVRTNWKLSFVTVEYELSNKGIELKFKPAKRFSFLVGEDEPTKTYLQQLSPIFDSDNKPTLKEIEEAFSVSRLSNDFYKEYKDKFFKLVDHLEQNKDFMAESQRLGFENEPDKHNKFAVTFAKKTLGQIVFLYFVQKKGWLGVPKDKNWGDGDKNYLIHSAKSFTGDNYFNDFLEPLFYNALNCKRENDEYLGKKIPFLNGGLFHPIENYDWKNTNFIIPNDYWINSEETGLLDVFSQYNFTVDESNPTEQEVAIDPEMLGKIFESLLDTDDRSEKGAFYTPREIVHYMCEEALASRLSTILGLDNDAIINYIRYGDALKETEFIKEFASDIDECVSNFTIVDPAVGSGAFLVGMLNQIVKLRTNLLEFTDKKIDKYQLKLEAIQKSLYGVDVEYDAVEIAKLRLWLSLIVDQDTNGNCPNPLPNLNFHLRVGNSLVDKFEGIVLWNPRWKSTKAKEKKIIQPDLFNTDTLDSILHRLKEAKKEYFLTYDEAKKEKLIQSIEREQIELIRTTLVTKGAFDTYDNLSKMLEKKTKPFFVWELEFGEVFENGGFDIAIANPPYVQLQKNGGKLANELQDLGYKTFARTGDIYCIFYEKGVQILKEDGVLCFITSNKWMRAGYGEKTRKFLSENTNPIKLIDFAGTKVFESATVDVNILLAKNQKNTQNTLACIIKDNCTNNLSDYVKQNGSIQSFTTSSNWTILSAIEQSIKNKIESVGVPLSKWDISINRGILTGYNEAFIIDEEIKNKLISEDPKSAELIRPILRGKDIKRYGYDFSNRYLICIPCGFTRKYSILSNPEEWFKNSYPAIYHFFIYVEKKHSKTRSPKSKGLFKRDDQGDYWWELRSCKYMDDFFRPKIIFQEMVQAPSFCLDKKGEFMCLDTARIITGENLDYLIMLFNSNLFFYAIKKFYGGGALGNKGVRMKHTFFMQFPAMVIDQNEFAIFIRKIQNLNNKERVINNFFYSKYNLSEEEINEIENEMKD